MTPLKKLGWIAAGYGAAAAVAVLVLRARYQFLDPAVVTASSGMYAGGDLIGFVLIAGTLGLVPTFFLLRLATEAYPRALAAVLLTLSATGPLSLLLLTAVLPEPLQLSPAVKNALGAAMVFLIFPRVVGIPVMFAVLGVAFLLAQDNRARVLLACGLAIEAVPLILIALHFARALLPR